MAGAACVSVASAVAMLPATSASGSATDEPTTSTLNAYKGQASANAAYFLAALPRFLIIENLFNGGGPTAQAALDSLGSSTGFASFPYPGDLAVAAPGLAGTLSGKPVPTYPFVVTSQYPSAQEVSLDQPGYHLDSVAHETEARSNAQAGARLAPSTDEAGAFATAAVVRNAADFTSVAESRLDLQVGAVAIHGATSKAEVVVDNAGKVARHSDFRVSSLSVNGVGVAITQNGLQLIGSVQPAQKSLTVGHTTIRFVEASGTEDSVLAPGLQITTPMDVPAPVGRTVVVDFIIGRSFAQATGTSGPMVAVGPGTGTAVPPVSQTTGGNGVDTVALGGLPATRGVVAGALPGAVAPVTVPGTQAFELTNTQPSAVSLPTLGAYPYIAGGALLFVIVSVGTRWVVGVRRSWS